MQYGECLCELCEINHNLGSQVAVFKKEACNHDLYIDGLNNSVNDLHATVNSMLDCLCHCSEGKGKEREIIIKMEEESEGLEYASEDEYKMAPSTSEVVVRELILIKQDPESGEVMQEAKESCGCGLEDHPIIISEDEVTVVNNAIPVQIQVECLIPEDRVVSDQHTVHSSSPICSSHPTHITGIPVNLCSNYILAKAIEHKC